MYNTTSGGYNVAVGNSALQNQTTGSNNVAVGRIAGTSITTGDRNTIVGGSYATGAGASLTTGARNTIFGNDAGKTVTTGTDNVYIGHSTTASGTNPNNEMVIGTNGGTGKGTNTGFIYINGGGSIYNSGNTSSWQTVSDERLKKNIVDNNLGLDLISQIKIRNFEYRLPEEIQDGLKNSDAITKQGTQIGIIAQELQQVLPDCVKEQSTGVLSVDTNNFTWYLINAIKELKAEIDLLKNK